MIPEHDFFDEQDESVRFLRATDPLQLDDGTVDRLLDGLPADDAPPSYRGVAELLHAAKHEPIDGVGATRPPRFVPSPQVTFARPTSRTKKPTAMRRLQVTGGALIGSAILFMGLGVAGALPGSAQGVAADVLASVGVHAPNPDAPSDVQVHPASAHESSGSSDSGGAGGPVTATSNGKGGTISGIASDGSTTGNDKGAAVSGTASDGKSQAGENDAPSSSDTDPANDSGNPAVGNNGNGKDVGNGANNGNGFAGDGNAGNAGTGQPNKP